MQYIQIFPERYRQKSFTRSSIIILFALDSRHSFVAGKSVATSNIIIFLPKNDGIDTDEDDGNDVNYISDNLVESKFHQMLNRICKEQEAQN